MLDIEIAMKSRWYKNDVDSIYHSSLESIEPKWLYNLKSFIENEYHVRIMTLTYDEKSDKVYIIFYDYIDIKSFFEKSNIVFWQPPVELNKKAIELSGKMTIQCDICPCTFVPEASSTVFSSVERQYECKLLDIISDNLPCWLYFKNYFVFIFETQEQAGEFLKSDYKQQMHKKIFEIAKTMDEYGVIKESDVYVLADYQAHYDQMEGHYHQWLEELNFDEMNNYENMLAMI
jgi:hypothetical protein